MAKKQKKYDTEYKVQAMKLTQEIGPIKAASELEIPVNTIYGWQKAVREGRLDVGSGAHLGAYPQSVRQPAILQAFLFVAVDLIP